MSDILMIVTAATSLTLRDGAEHPTASGPRNSSPPTAICVAAGHTVTIATPGGVTPTVDAGSLDAGVAAAPRRRTSCAATSP